MTVYLFLDDEGFCEGWSSNDGENLIPYETKNETILNGIMKYRYYDGVLIYDESKALKNAKASRNSRAKDQLADHLAKGFTVTLDGEDYTYPYNEENKAYLNKVNELVKSNLINEANFNFYKGVQEVSLSVKKVNIDEMWLLSFLHEEFCQKIYDTYILDVAKAKSLAQLQKVKYGEEELING